MEVSGSGASAPDVSGDLGSKDGQAETPPTAVPKAKVKVGGIEKELSIDELVKDYQLKQASHDKFQQASALEKKANAVLEALNKGDLEFVRKNVPKDVFKKLSTDFLLDEIEWESLPENERRRIQAEKKLADYEQRESEREKSEKQKAAEAEKAQYQTQATEELNKAFVEVIEMHKANGLPVDHGYLARAIDVMISAHNKGAKIPVAQAFDIAVQEMNGFFDKRVKAFTPDDLMKSLTKEQIKGLNQLMIGNAKTFQSAPRTKSDAPVIKKDSKVGFNEFFDKILPNKYGG